MRPGSTTDVLVVGAGPTGLLLAGDLAAAGVSCAVLERREQESNLTRAFAVHARTLELLDMCGVADELVGGGQTVGSLRLFGSVEIDLTRLPTRFPFLLVTPQYRTERLLEERAQALGARIIRGARITGVRQDEDGVDVDAWYADGTVSYRAAFAVGCDGADSTVRRALQLPFPGQSAVQSVMLADVRLTRPPADPLTVDTAREGFAFIAPFGDGWHRVIAWDRRHQRPDDAPVSLDEIRAITRLALGADYGMHGARWLSRFHSDERQVPHYRSGRVFLAGDAAHVHSPAGGQGMNTGLQDAANLSWKLAAAIHGWAAPGLLDTYHAERHPVGRSVLRASGGLLRAAMLQPRFLRAIRNLLAGLATRIDPINRALAGRVSGIDIRYPTSAGAHPLAGKRAPDMALHPDGSPGQLYQALHRGTLVLLTPDTDTGTAAVVKRWGIPLTVLPGTGPTTTLVRPDGYVAWASDEADPDARNTALHAALAHWYDEPATAT